MKNNMENNMENLYKIIQNQTVNIDRNKYFSSILRTQIIEWVYKYLTSCNKISNLFYFVTFTLLIPFFNVPPTYSAETSSPLSSCTFRFSSFWRLAFECRNHSIILRWILPWSVSGIFWSTQPRKTFSLF